MSPSKDGPPAPVLGKMAIKGFSLTAKASSSKPGKQALPSATSNLRKRPRASFQHDSDSEYEHDRRSGGKGGGRHEAVTGFGDAGAERDGSGSGSGKRGGELVIQKMANRDWRSEARARGSGKDLLPPEARAQRIAAVGEERRGGGGKGRDGKGGKTEGVDVVNGNDRAIQWGLSVRKRASTEDSDGDGDGTQQQLEGQEQDDKITSEENTVEQPTPKTADEEALASLLGQSTSNNKPTLTIPAAPAPLTEHEAYKAAVLSAPDVSSLEDYERIPVEEFGAALLRGMGWKGEKNVKPKGKDVKRRQNLLGLGAKELDGAEELGAWVQKSDVQRLNPGGGKGAERRPKAGDYKREKERQRERREERGGGGYRREREREGERDGGSGGGGRDRHREYRR